MLSQTAINTGSNFSLQAVEFTYMLVIDLMFLVALVVLMLPLGIWRQAAFAVMKRNFVGYFSNPTGYVFLCLFVLLTSFAAFWPHEFFTTNLANFDQLNKFLPYIMLVFIPAITMSIWAEERRQGTDELLLTLPAKDFDIVIGKYFAAVLVFTVSLLFSQLSNYTVLLSMTGGELDNLMLFSTYLGYWFMGIAMISVGMVASFLTNNLTVGFIFGAAFNAPLAFFSNADVIFSDSLWVQRLFDWSLLQRFEPFGRGLISVSSIVYFLGIVVIGVYLSLILIGRRHWLGGRDGTSMVWHYAVRAVLVVIIAVSAVLVVQHSPINQARVDISDAQINTLAPATLSLLEELKNDTSEDAQPVNIEAFVSNNIPSEFVRMKYDLLNLLREFDALGGKRVNVQLHQGIGPFSQVAIQAEKKYGIRPVKFRSEQRGAVREEEIVLGIALSCGIERIVLPFLNYGVPIEYELMQSVSAVAKPSKKRIGVVETDILPFGGPIRTQEETIQIRKLRFLTELQKQYEVERVDASSPITLFEEDADGKILRRRYDALMVIQPSATTKSELKNVIDAIRMGQPTLILEDPLPTPQNFAQIRGTLMPRALPRGEAEQADIKSLWNVLGMDVDLQRRGNATQSALFPNVLWHVPAQNPYKRSQLLNQPPQLIIAQDSPSDPRFSSEHPATRDITELYFQFAGYFRKNPKSDLNYIELVNSGRAGTVSALDVIQSQSAQQLGERLGLPNRQEMIAAAIQGEKANEPLPEKPTDIQKDQENINVIYIADVDTLSDTYLAVRDAPVINGVEYRYQNVSFLMNAIDSLTNVEDFMNLRNRRFRHVTLEKIEETYNEAMEEVFKLDEELGIEYQNRLNQARDEILKATKPLEERIRRATAARDANKKYDARRLKAEEALLAQRRREQATKFQNTQQELENERQERKRDIELKAEMKIQKTQRDFKLAAVVIPPIPPLLVGLFVFARRRLREREGISKARRLK